MEGLSLFIGLKHIAKQLLGLHKETISCRLLKKLDHIHTEIVSKMRFLSLDKDMLEEKFKKKQKIPNDIIMCKIFSTI